MFAPQFESEKEYILSPAPLIQVFDLVRRDASSGRMLLDHINLEINPGDRVGLVGPSGSGKSSLLRAIVKLDRVDSGDVLYRGRRIERNDVPEFRREVIYLSQRPALLRGTVRENLEMPFGLKIADARFEQDSVAVWLERLKQPLQLLDQTADNLSGGEQQLVALLRAIALEPRVLLLDEPTASLDAASTDRFEQLVAAWQSGDEENARALVWTSHDENQVGRMTNRNIAMHEARLVESVIDA